VRSGPDHSVVDGDGHFLELAPLLFSYMEKVGGTDGGARAATALTKEPLLGLGDSATGAQRAAWWATSSDALELATVTVPGLLAERMDEVGFDFAVMYPSGGLLFPTIPDLEARAIACRAVNTMYAEMTASYSNRLTVAASIPMHSPDEAVRELEYCVNALGMKAAVIPPGIARPLEAYPDAFPAACFADRYGIDSPYDYDAVWDAFQRLGVAVTFHGAPGMRFMDGAAGSPTNYVFNHLLGHARQLSEVCKALLLGGVPMRFPRLKFGFLEGGAGWACDLLAQVIEHWEKRSTPGLNRYDPSRLDVEHYRSLLDRFGLPCPASAARSGDWARDEFEQSGVDHVEQWVEIFTRQFFFGCEAEDRSVYRALDTEGNPGGARLNPVFSSDIGHWDVPDICKVLEESRTLLEAGLVTSSDYRDFVLTNVVRLHGSMNPRFFDGTPVQESARLILAEESATAR